MESSATPQGTQQFAARHIQSGVARSGFRPLGSTGLTCSTVGFGCYRIEDVSPLYKEALVSALRGGCNLIDTSANYADGHSEKCVGAALQALQHEVPRSQLIVVSKVGYVQGENLTLARQKEKDKKPFPDMVKYMDGCWHCISPEFIEDQLSRSLTRLGIKQIDVYLLHNPEYFLMDAVKRSNTDLQSCRLEFYRRIEQAFLQLENEVKAGRIRYYGVSSNTFGADSQAADAVSLSRVWEIAQAVSYRVWGKEKTHFAVAQLPLNLFETGPYFRKNNGDKTVLEFAHEKNIAILVNRPLNAITGNQLIRLADFPQSPAESTLEEALKDTKDLEKAFRHSLAEKIQVEDRQVDPHEFFRWAHEIEKVDLHSLPRESWMELEEQMIIPQTRYLREQLQKHFSALGHGDLWAQWEERYFPSLERLLAHGRNICNQKSQQISRQVAAAIEPFLPEMIRKEPLSRTALAVLANTPGVTCVLVGMRRPSYVKDVLAAQNLASFAVDPAVYGAFRRT